MESIMDVHCHLLPGIDDGPDNMEEAIELLRMKYEQGVTTVVATPHHRMGYFETPREKVREVFFQMKQEAVKSGIGVQLLLGCEFHRESRILELLEEDSAYRMNDTDYILIEFSEADSYSTIRNYTVGLLRSGYKPIIAHAERYIPAIGIEEARTLVREGARIQINSGSVLGKEGWGRKRFCKKLLKNHLVHFIGSDAHDLKVRVPLLKECEQYLEKKYGKPVVMRLFQENPWRMIKNQDINLD